MIRKQKKMTHSTTQAETYPQAKSKLDLTCVLLRFVMPRFTIEQGIKT